MDKLLTNRWTARDKELNESILRVQGEMNRRGILPSSISVKEHHDVFLVEFQASRDTIIKTIIDYLQANDIKPNRTELQVWAMNKLAERRDKLDSLFLQKAKVSFQGLQNQTMIAPFMNIAQYYEHAAQVLIIELKKAIDEYEKKLGETLTARIVNNFKNRPVIAFGIIVVIVIAAILGIYATIKELVS